MSPHDLPPDLRALAEAAARRLSASLRAGTERLSAGYRAGARSDEGMDFGAYLAARLPATYAAASRVLSELAARQPNFMPASVFDVGSGPGTAAWAALSHFPGLSSVAFFDSNRRFLDLALELAHQSETPALLSARGEVADMMLSAGAGSSDLVMLVYALAEIPEARAKEVALALWARTTGALVLIEPGTPAGFARIRAAREALIGTGAHIAAPCPHDAACPMAGQDWCHFTVRLARSRMHMQAKSARVPFEDEPYSYLIAMRSEPGERPARIIAPPVTGKPGITLRLCEGAGLSTRTVGKRDGEAFRHARKLSWGDPF